MEKDYGSILKATALGKKEKPSRFVPKGISRTVSFAGGMQTLTDKLAENLRDEVKTETKVFSIGRVESGKWRVESDLEDLNRESFDAVVVATPSFVAANFIENLDSELSEKLRDVYHPPLAVIVSACGRENVKKDLDGFGFLIPKVERRQILGSLWSSVIFENRAPKNVHLLTTFIGGARNAELFDRTDAELFEIARAELSDILGVQGEPVFQRIKRWTKAIPQYNIGYEKIEKGIKDFEQNNKGIFFCSNFYRGISVGDCIKNAYLTADEIAEFLSE
jgi:oxygen-dependent protoporphyrinogen oxidase